MSDDLASKADTLRHLHHGTRPLVLPNAWDVASARLVEGAGFPVVATSSAAVARTLGYEDDDTMPAGNVLGTDPAKGTVLAPGTEVTIKVSKGKAPISVPNVIGTDLATAQQKLTDLGLQVAVQQQQSDKPANQVISQDPPEGSGLQKGDRVILTVSSGPPLVAVPDVSNQGLNFDQANQILQQAGLVAVKVFEFPGGQVRQQNPGANTQVPKGTQVQLWVYP